MAQAPTVLLVPDKGVTVIQGCFKFNHAAGQKIAALAGASKVTANPVGAHLVRLSAEAGGGDVFVQRVAAAGVAVDDGTALHIPPGGVDYLVCDPTDYIAAIGASGGLRILPVLES